MLWRGRNEKDNRNNVLKINLFFVFMNSIKEQIIDSLNAMQLSTEEVSDMLGKKGVVKNVHPINYGIYVAGEIQYIYAYGNSNWPVHEQLRNLEPNRIAFVDAINISDYAVFGELVSTFIMKGKNASGIVVNGLMRDVDGIRKRVIPAWCNGITPIGCFNKPVEETEEIKQIVKTAKAYYDGAIAVCDDSGVVIIPKEEINEHFLERMSEMRKQEEIWFDCVENRGWDTFDTVCLKKYKNE